MNKILIDKDDKNIKLSSGEYMLEYVSDGEYNLNFIIDGDVKLIECSFDRDITINNNYRIDNGCLDIVRFYNNLRVSQVDNLNLYNSSSVNYSFSNICRGVENYIININHNDKNTKSNINNKSIALMNSDIKYTINSSVFKKCVNSLLDQNTRIVTMGECNTSIKPNMFIDLDQVEARHGSVIGSFKEDQIFYLMSKGICYNDAIKLLIKGYLLANFSGDVELRFRIMDIIDTYWR